MPPASVSCITVRTQKPGNRVPFPGPDGHLINPVRENSLKAVRSGIGNRRQPRGLRRIWPIVVSYRLRFSHVPWVVPEHNAATRVQEAKFKDCQAPERQALSRCAFCFEIATPFLNRERPTDPDLPSECFSYPQRPKSQSPRTSIEGFPEW